MNQEEYRIRRAGINGKIKQAKSLIDFYQLKILDLEKTVSKLNEEKHDLIKETKK